MEGKFRKRGKISFNAGYKAYQDAMKEVISHAERGAQEFMVKRLEELGFDPLMLFDQPCPVYKLGNTERPAYFEYYLSRPEGQEIFLFSEMLEVVPIPDGFGLKQELQNEKR